MRAARFFLVFSFFSLYLNMYLFPMAEPEPVSAPHIATARREADVTRFLIESDMEYVITEPIGKFSSADLQKNIESLENRNTTQSPEEDLRLLTETDDAISVVADEMETDQAELDNARQQYRNKFNIAERALSVFGQNGAAAFKQEIVSPRVQEINQDQSVYQRAQQLRDQLQSKLPNSFRVAAMSEQKKVIFVERSDRRYDLCFIDPENNEVVRLTDNTDVERAPQISPDGKQVLFMACPPEFESFDERIDSFDIFVINTDGTGLRKLVESSIHEGYPQWSPDGSKIMYEVTIGISSSRELHIISLDGSDHSIVTKSSVSNSRPVWSPDGSQIFFSSFRDGNIQLYRINTDGTDEVQLTNDSGGAMSTHLSPDGKKVAYCNFKSTAGGGFGLYVVNCDGTDNRRITPSGRFIHEIDWSPDSSKLAVVQSNGLFTVNDDGTERCKLASTWSLWPIYESIGGVSWSDNSEQLTYYFGRGLYGTDKLFVINSDGSNKRNVK